MPDNVLFEGDVGETVRCKLLQESDMHAIPRLPTGIFYVRGVKANVLFFECKPSRDGGGMVYDNRTNIHHTLKRNPFTRADLDDSRAPTATSAPLPYLTI